MFVPSLSWLSLLVMGYLIGSFPTAYLIGRLQGIDIRQYGDGNMGAANAFRVLGPKYGILVGVVDIAKGAAAVMMAHAYLGPGLPQFVAAIAAVTGHVWPFFLGFRGGRGAASVMGALLTMVPMPTMPLALGSLFILWLTHSTTVALGFIFIPLPLLTWFSTNDYSLVAYAVALPVLAGLCHTISVWRTRDMVGLKVGDRAPNRG